MLASQSPCMAEDMERERQGLLGMECFKPTSFLKEEGPADNSDVHSYLKVWKEVSLPT